MLLSSLVVDDSKRDRSAAVAVAAGAVSVRFFIGHTVVLKVLRRCCVELVLVVFIDCLLRRHDYASLFMRTLVIRMYDVTEAERDDELGDLGDLHT